VQEPLRGKSSSHKELGASELSEMKRLEPRALKPRHSRAGGNPVLLFKMLLNFVFAMQGDYSIDWIDETTSQSTKPASWQVAGYPAYAGMTGAECALSIGDFCDG
jgi:hypothetical protein